MRLKLQLTEYPSLPLTRSFQACERNYSSLCKHEKCTKTFVEPHCAFCTLSYSRIMMAWQRTLRKRSCSLCRYNRLRLFHAIYSCLSIHCNYSFWLPVSVVTALLGALEHWRSRALRAKVRFWLHISGGKLHIPSDVELHSNVWTLPWLSVAMTT